MIRELQNYIEKELLFKPAKDRILLAVSGGMDSVALAHLFDEGGFQFGIAHCNFQLRGADSDQDADFVEQLAAQLGTSFYKAVFDTKSVATSTKQSIQIVAREQRYDWLESIRIAHGYDYIATAHQLNDSIETLLYNFTKGCGIRGLHGIPPGNGKIVRPILFASRQDIEQFVRQKNITYREDVSNSSDDYDRNKIRHHVIPVLQSINPALEETCRQSIQHIREAEIIYMAAIKQFRNAFVSEQDGMIRIDLTGVRNQKATSSILYELLRPYQFNSSHVTQILEIHSTESGRQFFSATHRLLVDREQLVLQALEMKKELQEIMVPRHTERISLTDTTFILEWNAPVPKSLKVDAQSAFLDQALLSDPLKLRKWQEGDIFQPFGLSGSQQKLKDFFINNKLSLIEKEKIWILESGGQICWIAGHRIDERFKVSEDTQKCLIIKMLHNSKLSS